MGLKSLESGGNVAGGMCTREHIFTHVGIQQRVIAAFKALKCVHDEIMKFSPTNIAHKLSDHRILLRPHPNYQISYLLYLESNAHTQAYVFTIPMRICIHRHPGTTALTCTMSI